MRAIFISLVAGVLGWAGLAVHGQEVTIAADEFNRLDTFEAHLLSKADRAFAARDYRSAAPGYDAFLLEYPKSQATAYAILRKGRSLELDLKRFDAIKTYAEVLDYFPNAVNYAAAALFHQGICHWENGDIEPAIKAWVEMVRDEDYQHHFLAAGALMRLGENFFKQGKPAEGVKYYEQAALEFRRKNSAVANAAIARVVWYYVRQLPDQEKLWAFYEKAETFEGSPGKPSEQNYWGRVRGAISSHGSFPDTEKDARDKYYRYWSGMMEGKFLDWDDFQIDLAGYRRAYENDQAKWVERMDQQFKRLEKAEDYNRVLRWLSFFAEIKPKAQEYYGKLDFAKMTAPQIQQLMQILFEQVRDVGMAKNAFTKLPLGKMSDGEKVNLARYFWSRDESLVELVCQYISDKELGRMELLRCYHARRNLAKGLPLANEMAGIPARSKEAYWMKAEMLQSASKFEEAIVAYQAVDNPPQNLWRIVECYLAAKKSDQALAQLREIENFFQDQAPEAAMRIANVYSDRGDRTQQVATLRGVMKKYPKSAQSSAAHLALARLGVLRIHGGVDAE